MQWSVWFRHYNMSSFESIATKRFDSQYKQRFPYNNINMQFFASTYAKTNKLKLKQMLRATIAVYVAVFPWLWHAIYRRRWCILSDVWNKHEDFILHALLKQPIYLITFWRALYLKVNSSQLICFDLYTNKATYSTTLSAAKWKCLGIT